ncbi:MAG: FAD-binding oxidoreductase, partial [Actinomycetota bacterium]|nr:FAD-binding oxidoreductase [Actinomycetota bacterium]
RNGGWCSALFATAGDKLARKRGRDAAIAMQQGMFATVDEVERATNELGIDCHFHKGGTLTLATAFAHVPRIKDEIAAERRWGFSEDDYRWLEQGDAAARLNASGVLGAGFTPHCASIHPARLVRGLARSVEGAGVTIYEQTAARSLKRGSVETDGGTLRADVVVRATEGYTTELPGRRRALAPVYSLMVATEPLGPELWDEIGWAGRETFTDGRHLLIYGQRTKDDRIAFGGRGAPYHFGSRVKDSYDRVPAVFDELRKVLRSLFPALASCEFTHEWGGPVALPRDWTTSVGFDRDEGLAWAGGYVGDGVSTTNLAGRTLTDLILGRTTELTRLPWVNHRSREWEPEPLRWIGANVLLKVMASADRAEARSGRPARRAELAYKLLGI